MFVGDLFGENSPRNLADDAWAMWAHDVERHPMEFAAHQLLGDLPPGWVWAGGTTPVRLPSWFTPSVGAKTVAKNVRDGLHPLGWRMHTHALLDAPGRTKCGQCRHAQSNGRYGNKCKKREAIKTTGPAFDIRFKWGACEHFERKGGEDV